MPKPILVTLLASIPAIPVSLIKKAQILPRPVGGRSCGCRMISVSIDAVPADGHVIDATRLGSPEPQPVADICRQLRVRSPYSR